MEIPGVLKSLFSSLSVNAYGIYMARLTFGGVRMEVVVDDFVPCDESSRPLFVQASKSSEIWMIVLVKCFAKLYGSYELLFGKRWTYEGEPTSQLLHAITGAPVDTLALNEGKEQSSTWLRLVNGYNRGHFICLQARNVEELESSKNGLFP